jgi:hypothetical protein
VKSFKLTGGHFHLAQHAAFGPRSDHFYTLCGWQVSSDIALTAVPTSAPVNDSDIRIQIAPGDSPIGKNASEFEHSVELSLIRIKDVADFEIREGRQIRIWPRAGVTQKDIEIFLFGQAWAILCHQRGMLPLHASAIVTKSGIMAFAGHSGAGKSTIAALLNSLGCELFADDILSISFNQNSEPGAWPYLRRLKLHDGPIVQLGLTPIAAVSETLDKEKYFVRPKSTGNDKWRRLERVYLLENNSADLHARIERITGADAVHALVDQTYQFKFILGTRRFAEHLAFCTQLASNILMYRLRRSAITDAGKNLSPLLRAHIDDAIS